MNFFENKYGRKEDDKIKQYHKSRRMFAINNGQVYAADMDVDYSHAEWFKKLGWIDETNDNLIDEVTRGSLEPAGLWFYKGYNFVIDGETEKDMMLHLNEIVTKLQVPHELHLLGGKTFDKQGYACPICDYGEIGTLIGN
ncbi:MAG: hypothetical protein AAB914_03015 [Patescibacteria group bacterium]